MGHKAELWRVETVWLSCNETMIGTEKTCPFPKPTKPAFSANFHVSRVSISPYQGRTRHNENMDSSVGWNSEQWRRSTLRPSGWTWTGPGASECIEGRRDLSELQGLGLGERRAHQTVGIFKALASVQYPFRPRTAVHTGSEGRGLTEGDPAAQLQLATGMHQWRCEGEKMQPTQARPGPVPRAVPCKPQVVCENTSEAPSWTLRPLRGSAATRASNTRRFPPHLVQSLLARYLGDGHRLHSTEHVPHRGSSDRAAGAQWNPRTRGSSADRGGRPIRRHPRVEPQPEVYCSLSTEPAPRHFCVKAARPMRTRVQGF